MCDSSAAASCAVLLIVSSNVFVLLLHLQQSTRRLVIHLAGEMPNQENYHENVNRSVQEPNGFLMSNGGCHMSSPSSSSSTSSSSSSDSSSSNDSEDVTPRQERITSLIEINSSLANQLDRLQHENNSLIERMKHFQENHAGLNSKVPNGIPNRVKVSEEKNFSEPCTVALGKGDPLFVSLRKEVSLLTEQKKDLLDENKTLQKEKRMLEAALSKSRRELEGAAAAVVEKISPVNRTARIYEWDSDVQRLCNLSGLLSDENATLREQSREQEMELSSLREDLTTLQAQKNEIASELSSSQAQNEAMERELHRITEGLQKAVEEANLARDKSTEELDVARKTIDDLQDEKAGLTEENVRLERELSEVIENLEELEQRQYLLIADKEKLMGENTRLERELSTVFDRLAEGKEAEAQQSKEFGKKQDDKELELQRELTDTRSELQKAYEESENERNSREELLKEVAILRLKERALGEDLRLARSCLVKIRKEGNKQAPMLESQLTTWLKQQDGLQEMDNAMEDELKELTTSFSQSLEKVENELNEWKERALDLESALKKARRRGALTETKAQKLISEVHPRIQQSKCILHATVASGALAGFGLLAYMKFRHQFRS